MPSRPSPAQPWVVSHARHPHKVRKYSRHLSPRCRKEEGNPFLSAKENEKMLAPSINPYPFPVMHPSQSISPYPIHLNECGKCSMIMLQSILIHLPKGKKKWRPKEDETEGKLPRREEGTGKRREGGRWRLKSNPSSHPRSPVHLSSRDRKRSRRRAPA